MQHIKQKLVKMAASSRISLGSGSLISFSARQTRRSLHANSSLCSMCQLSSMPKPLFTDFNSLPHQKVSLPSSPSLSSAAVILLVLLLTLHFSVFVLLVLGVNFSS